jgi:hypothetical protein
MVLTTPLSRIILRYLAGFVSSEKKILNINTELLPFSK